MKTENFDIKIIRSDRKTIAVEITPDMRVIIRAPRTLPDRYISDFVAKKAEWIEKHLSLMKAKNEKRQNLAALRLSSEEIKVLANKAHEYIPKRVRYYTPIVEVEYGRVTIRNQTTRWGSCSSKGNLNFNCLLMLMPSEVIDYVVVHELCHRKYMNHSKCFWSEVEKVLPDYKTQKKWLKENGNAMLMLVK